MEVKFKKNEKKSNHVGEKIRIGVADTAIIADLLRKHYAHPIRTLVQEYLSNARDAQRENKNTKDKIVVTLPTKISPSLKIRDFGPGLSPDRVLTVFSQLGSSTKRSNNNQTGGFGIGSKSAFAYRENFMVRSFFNGKETLYEVSTAHSHEGELEVVYEGKTKEKNGVEIEIPVKSGDEKEFVKSVYRASMFWTEQERPVLKGADLGEGSTFPKLNVFLEEGNLKSIKKTSEMNNILGHNSLLFVLDGIPYDVTLPYQYSQYNRHTSLWVLSYPTGKFKVSISRESIEQNKESAEMLLTEVKTINTKVDAFLKKKFQNKTLAEKLSLSKTIAQEDFINQTKFQTELDTTLGICIKLNDRSYGNNKWTMVSKNATLRYYKVDEKNNNKIIHRDVTVEDIFNKKMKFVINNNNSSDEKIMSAMKEYRKEKFGECIVVRTTNPASKAAWEKKGTKKISELLAKIKKRANNTITVYNCSTKKHNKLNLNSKELNLNYVYAHYEEEGKKASQMCQMNKKDVLIPEPIKNLLRDTKNVTLILLKTKDLATFKEKFKGKYNSFEKFPNCEKKSFIDKEQKKKLAAQWVCNDLDDAHLSLIENLLDILKTNVKLKKYKNIIPNNFYGWNDKLSKTQVEFYKTIILPEYNELKNKLTPMIAFVEKLKKENLVYYYLLSNEDIRDNLFTYSRRGDNDAVKLKTQLITFLNSEIKKNKKL